VPEAVIAVLSVSNVIPPPAFKVTEVTVPFGSSPDGIRIQLEPLLTNTSPTLAATP